MLQALLAALGPIIAEMAGSAGGAATAGSGLGATLGTAATGAAAGSALGQGGFAGLIANPESTILTQGLGFTPQQAGTVSSMNKQAASKQQQKRYNALGQQEQSLASFMDMIANDPYGSLQ